jgi:hypothetical protein
VPVPRIRASAGAVIAVTLLVAAAPLAAFHGDHSVCATTSHACGQTTRLVPCCCGEHPTDSDAAASVPAKFQPSPVFSAIAPAGAVTATFVSRPPSHRPVMLPAHLAILDLPTLLSTLLL